MHHISPRQDMVSSMPTIAYIGLGSNLGDKEANCRKAIALLEKSGRVTSVSSLYCTEPVGLAEQDDFVNAVVELETVLPPEALLDRCLSIEKELGRKRTVHWGPRTIDVDILLYGDVMIETPELTIPHPLLHNRRFVLVPLSEIAPHVIHPKLQKTASDLLLDLRDHQSVVRCDENGTSP
jgi:2-amino-4-hydroxy-6-hydroxymethyldihydropteridine diphosphokinase